MAKLFTLLSVAATAVLLSLQNASARPLGLDGNDSLAAFKETTKAFVDCVVVKDSSVKFPGKSHFLKGRGEPSKVLVCSGTSITAIKVKDEHGNEYDLKNKYVGDEDKYDFKEQKSNYDWDNDKEYDDEKDDYEDGDGYEYDDGKVYKKQKDKYDWDNEKDYDD